MDEISRRLFVPMPGLSIRTIPGTGSSNTFSNRSPLPTTGNAFNQPGNKMDIIDGISRVKTAYDNLPPGVKVGIQDTFVRTIQGNPNASTSKHSSGYALSKAPDPDVTSLDSGIKPDAWVSDVLDAEEGVCSPLHINCVKLKIPDTAGNKMLDYFNRIIAFQIQTKAQANITFKLDINTDFSQVNILNALNAALKAHQVYFWYRSIITYHSDPINKNEGMIALRTGITADVLEKLALLGRRLADTPFPPRLYELVRYLSANYYSGPNQGSAMIKLCPCGGTNAALLHSIAYIDSAISDMNQPANNQVYTLLRRAVPHWKPGVLKDVPTTVAYDEQFLTIFANCPLRTSNTVLTNRNIPIVTSDSTPIAYNSFTNVLDGVAFALTAGSIGLDDWQPSLLIPDRLTTLDTRRSWYRISGVSQFVNSESIPMLGRSRPDTYQWSDSGASVYPVHLSGADKVQGVNVSSIRETTNKALDYLMSLDMIAKSVQEVRDFDNPASTVKNSRSKRRRGK